MKRLCLALALTFCACGGTDTTDVGPIGDADGGGGDAGSDAAAGKSNCEAYCDNVMENCTGRQQLYPNRETCMTTCAAFPANGTPGATMGNTVQCRIYHSGAPAKMDPVFHCPHASASSKDDVCGTPCEGYCDQVTKNCPATYPNRDACMATCASFPKTGTATATQGNSVECRTYHASFPAAQMPGMHCPHATANGGGVCGTYCQAYCDQIMGNCSGGNAQYANRAACLSACGAIPETGSSTATAGNSIQCRTYHASFPAAQMPALHCPHASATGGEVCGSLCAAYCDQVTAHCAGANAVYPNRAACMDACGAMPESGMSTVTSGDSVECRINHAAQPAALLPATECPVAGASGGGTCGSYCEAYCDQVTAHCTGANAGYADRAQCMSACGVMKADGMPGAAAGNSVQCRLNQASWPAAQMPQMRCKAASLSGGGVCGSYCEVYCDFAARHCTGGNTLYASENACQLACGGFSTDGANNATSGDTVQCRIHHASFPAAATPAMSCPSASSTPTAPCN